MIGKYINRVLFNFGLTITFVNDLKNDKDFMYLYNLCKPYTMTSIERMYALYNSLNYVIENNINGDFVECGVWKGGSAMLIAEFLSIKNITHKKIIMYDTYEGMTLPSEKDIDFNGKKAKELYKDTWCYSSLEEVKSNMSLTNFDQNNIIYIKGKVEETIPKLIPCSSIALLRLDTDWYDSTIHELNFLYPLLEKKGILIIDDFGFWAGAKKAVLEYFNKNEITMNLSRIDYTGRVGIKY
jgi:hypothetical protein